MGKHINYLLGFFTFIFIFTWINAESPTAIPCRGSSQSARNVTIDVSGCTNTTRCPLIRGSSHIVTVSFIPTKNSSSNVNRRIYGVFHGLPIPYGRSEKICENARDEFNSTCKETKGLIADRKYTYNSVFPVQPFFPSLALNVRYQFTDGKNPIVCVELPVQIVSRH
ncbi:NPC intracellular cholesterol transporter 2 [Centruroides vittatus]|uniref:NPC intracellular cholesterol transporter 2 n=1 Tax=Centruroides vittatus TaxID=120091 RepID=UPI00350F84BB